MATAAHNLYGRNRSPLRRYGRAALLIALVVVFCIGGVGLLTGRVRDLTPDELRERMGDAVQGLPLEEAIAQINRMTPEQRREVMRSESARDYLLRLSPEQRRRFVRETLDRGIQEQLERYHRMNKDEREAFVAEIRKRQQEAREQMDRLPPDKKEELRRFANSENVAEMLEQASKAFLSLTTSAERAELQSLYEGALDNLQHAQKLK